MTSLVVDTEHCLGQCAGTIANVIRLSDVKHESNGLKALLGNYELFRFSDLTNLKYPKTGPPDFNFKVRRKLKYVLISFSASTFDRIKKVSIKFYHHIYNIDKVGFKRFLDHHSISATT